MSDSPESSPAPIPQHPDGGQVGDLLQVLEISRQLAAVTEVETLLGSIEQAARNVLDCERATVFVYDREADELYSRVSTRDEKIRFPAGMGIAGECFRSGLVINVPDAYADARFNRAIDAKTGFRTRNLLTATLTGYDGQPVGVIQVLNKRDGAFDDWDETLVCTLSAQCGVALQRQFLLDEFAEKQKIERDLNIAHTIQQGLLPAKAPEVAGYDIAGWNRPAEATGGDFYSFLPPDDTHFALALADVTGHGIGPALVAAQCSALYQATFSLIHDVEQGTTRVNDLLSQNLPSDRFVTSFFAVLNTETDEMVYTSAGHGPLLLYRAATDEFTELPTHGLPLGVMPEIPYDESEKFTLESGDMLIAFTDGFFEWENATPEAFGTQRICDAVRTNREKSSAELIQDVYQSLLDFVQGTKQVDDLTAVIVKKL